MTTAEAKSSTCAANDSAAPVDADPRHAMRAAASDLRARFGRSLGLGVMTATGRGPLAQFVGFRGETAMSARGEADEFEGPQCEPNGDCADASRLSRSARFERTGVAGRERPRFRGGSEQARRARAMSNEHRHAITTAASEGTVVACGVYGM